MSLPRPSTRWHRTSKWKEGRNLEFRQFIDGEWTGASNGGSWELINPATEEIIDLIPFGNEADAVAAMDAAARAFPAWSDTTPYQRAAILEKTAALIKSRASEFAAERPG